MSPGRAVNDLQGIPGSVPYFACLNLRKKNDRIGARSMASSIGIDIERGTTRKKVLLKQRKRRSANLRSNVPFWFSGAALALPMLGVRWACTHAGPSVLCSGPVGRYHPKTPMAHTGALAQEPLHTSSDKSFSEARVLAPLGGKYATARKMSNCGVLKAWVRLEIECCQGGNLNFSLLGVWVGIWPQKAEIQSSTSAPETHLHSAASLGRRNLDFKPFFFPTEPKSDQLCSILTVLCGVLLRL